MEKQKNSKLNVIITLLLILATIIVVVCVALTFKTDLNGNITDNNNTTETNETNEIISHKEHQYNEQIKPGDSGSFEIALNTGDTKIDVKYVIIIDEIITNSTEKNNKQIKLYTDEKHKNEIELGKENNKLIGTIIHYQTDEEEANEENYAQATKVIYWYWPQEENADENKEETIENMTIKYTIKANQIG